MTLARAWQNRNRPTISFEFFPPRTEKAAKRLNKVLAKLIPMDPDYVSVTFGAGGSSKEGSYQLLKQLRDNYQDTEVVAYLSAYGLGPTEINSVLDGYRDLGIETLFCIRGDEPTDLEGFSPHPESFVHASDLLAYVTERYDFFTGAAGYPEGHKDAESKQKDLEVLKLKVDQGARFIITQYFYDNLYFYDFVERCRAAGITVPIVAGIMPIYSLKMMEALAGICGVSITDTVRKGLAQLPSDDKEALNEFGIELAYQQCKELITKGVDGLHFYTLDRSSSVLGILTKLDQNQLL